MINGYKLRFYSLIIFFIPITAVADIRVVDETIYYTGSISEEQNQLFFDVINNQAIKRLVFNSTGGEIEAAIHLGLWIHRNQIDIEITEYCFSSCANYVFPAARHKVIRDGAIVAWHGNYHHLKHTGLWKQEILARMKKYDEDAATAEDFKRKEVEHLVSLEKDFFHQIGVDEYLCWFGKMPPYNVPNYYFLSKQDMAAFGVTHIEVPAHYEDTDVSGFKYEIQYINRSSE